MIPHEVLKGALDLGEASMNAVISGFWREAPATGVSMESDSSVESPPEAMTSSDERV